MKKERTPNYMFEGTFFEKFKITSLQQLRNIIIEFMLFTGIIHVLILFVYKMVQYESIGYQAATNVGVIDFINNSLKPLEQLGLLLVYFLMISMVAFIYGGIIIHDGAEREDFKKVSIQSNSLKVLCILFCYFHFIFIKIGNYLCKLCRLIVNKLSTLTLPQFNVIPIGIIIASILGISIAILYLKHDNQEKQQEIFK